ncbi:MAG: tRNA (N(6)-L-threonylcarbamoyladenosine(37)-C(2))-methylthiotransferase MtaB [Candidatus Omnitrophota bacterium]
MKTFFIKTLGCKVNQYESQIIREDLSRSGFTEVSGLDEADICVVNTCTVTSISDSKSVRAIRRALNEQKCVIATGCMVEDGQFDLSKLKGVRYIIKNKDKHRIANVINPASGIYPSGSSPSISGFKGHTRVFVKVQDGCNNTCSYCKVKVVRGRSISRPVENVVDECLQLITKGVKEIVLTGICLGAYGKDIKNGMNLSKLIKVLCDINGDWRLRLSSIEPKDIDNDLINQLESQRRLCKHLHLPFQSGDNCILKMMKRPYKAKDYIGVVNNLRGAVPDIAISTDVMVGFPGETEKRFENTVDFIETVRPMRMHIFPFSKRKGTEAYDYRDDVTLDVKRKREKKLFLIAAALSTEFLDKFIDKEVEVLVESRRAQDGNLQGYTDRYIKVYIDGPDNLKDRLISSQLTLTNSKAYGILHPYLI